MAESQVFKHFPTGKGTYQCSCGYQETHNLPHSYPLPKFCPQCKGEWFITENHYVWIDGKKFLL